MITLAAFYDFAMTIEITPCFQGTIYLVDIYIMKNNQIQPNIDAYD